MMDGERTVEAGYGVYLFVWAVLLVLTVLAFTVLRGIEGAAGVVAPVIIASVKAALVLLYFMHLRYERGVFRVIFWVVVITLIIVLWLLVEDVANRYGPGYGL